MIDHIISLISHIFFRQKKLVNLCNVYNEYLKDPNNVSLQLKLEIAYRHCYRKKASAKCIHRIASAQCGPLEALDSFGRSSSFLVGCDFKKHLPILGWFKRFPVFWNFLSFWFSLLVISVSISFIFVGLYIFANLADSLYFNPADNLFESWSALFGEIFLMALICISALVLGVVALYNGINIISRSNSEYRAIEVAKEVNVEEA